MEIFILKVLINSTIAHKIRVAKSNNNNNDSRTLEETLAHCLEKTCIYAVWFEHFFLMFPLHTGCRLSHFLCLPPRTTEVVYIWLSPLHLCWRVQLPWRPASFALSPGKLGKGRNMTSLTLHHDWENNQSVYTSGMMAKLLSYAEG